MAYNPYNAQDGGGGAFFVSNSNSTDCYGYKSKTYTAVFPDGSDYFENCDELRQYIIELEASRKLQDLVDVNFTRTVKKGDFLVYDNTSGKWVLTDFLSGGEF